jgi:hypothetical protein
MALPLQITLCHRGYSLPRSAYPMHSPSILVLWHDLCPIVQDSTRSDGRVPLKMSPALLGALQAIMLDDSAYGETADSIPRNVIFLDVTQLLPTAADLRSACQEEFRQDPRNLGKQFGRIVAKVIQRLFLKDATLIAADCMADLALKLLVTTDVRALSGEAIGRVRLIAPTLAPPTMNALLTPTCLLPLNLIIEVHWQSETQKSRRDALLQGVETLQVASYIPLAPVSGASRSKAVPTSQQAWWTYLTPLKETASTPHNLTHSERGEQLWLGTIQWVHNPSSKQIESVVYSLELETSTPDGKKSHKHGPSPRPSSQGGDAGHASGIPPVARRPRVGALVLRGCHCLLIKPQRGCWQLPMGEGPDTPPSTPSTPPLESSLQPIALRALGDALDISAEREVRRLSIIPPLPWRRGCSPGKQGGDVDWVLVFSAKRGPSRRLDAYDCSDADDDYDWYTWDRAMCRVEAWDREGLLLVASYLQVAASLPSALPAAWQQWGGHFGQDYLLSQLASLGEKKQRHQQASQWAGETMDCVLVLLPSWAFLLPSQAVASSSSSSAVTLSFQQGQVPIHPHRPSQCHWLFPGQTHPLSVATPTTGQPSIAQIVEMCHETLQDAPGLEGKEEEKEKEKGKILHLVMALESEMLGHVEVEVLRRMVEQRGRWKSVTVGVHLPQSGLVRLLRDYPILAAGCEAADVVTVESGPHAEGCRQLCQHLFPKDNGLSGSLQSTSSFSSSGHTLRHFQLSEGHWLGGIWRARSPMHPQRFLTLAEGKTENENGNENGNSCSSLLGKDSYLRGVLFLDCAGGWQRAFSTWSTSTGLEHASAHRWWAAMPHDQWPEGLAEEIAVYWSEDVGDRQSECRWVCPMDQAERLERTLAALCSETGMNQDEEHAAFPSSTDSDDDSESEDDDEEDDCESDDQ